MARFERMTVARARILFRASFSLDGVYQESEFSEDPRDPHWRIRVRNAAGLVLWDESARATNPDELPRLHRFVLDALATRVLCYLLVCGPGDLEDSELVSLRVRTPSEREAELVRTCVAGDTSEAFARPLFPVSFDSREHERPLMVSCESSWEDIRNGRSLPLALAEELL